MKFAILSVFLTVGSVLLYAQDIEPAPSDKAVVYFMRPNGLGALINFTYYDGDQVIGRFNAVKYLRYVCTPGEHTFWAQSENKSFIKADVEAGRIYLVEARAEMGGFKARVRLVPIDPKVAKLKPYQKLLAKRSSETFSTDELNAMKDVKVGAIDRGMNKLAKLEERRVEIPFLSSDMYVEVEELIFVKKEKKKKRGA